MVHSTPLRESYPQDGTAGTDDPTHARDSLAVQAGPGPSYSSRHVAGLENFGQGAGRSDRNQSGQSQYPDTDDFGLPPPRDPSHSLSERSLPSPQQLLHGASAFQPHAVGRLMSSNSPMVPPTSSARTPISDRNQEPRDGAVDISTSPNLGLAELSSRNPALTSIRPSLAAPFANASDSSQNQRQGERSRDPTSSQPFPRYSQSSSSSSASPSPTSTPLSAASSSTVMNPSDWSPAPGVKRKQDDRRTNTSTPLPALASLDIASATGPGGPGGESEGRGPSQYDSSAYPYLPPMHGPAADAPSLQRRNSSLSLREAPLGESSWRSILNPAADGHLGSHAQSSTSSGSTTSTEAVSVPMNYYDTRRHSIHSGAVGRLKSLRPKKKKKKSGHEGDEGPEEAVDDDEEDEEADEVGYALDFGVGSGIGPGGLGRHRATLPGRVRNGGMNPPRHPHPYHSPSSGSPSGGAGQRQHLGLHRHPSLSLTSSAKKFGPDVSWGYGQGSDTPSLAAASTHSLPVPWATSAGGGSGPGSNEFTFPSRPGTGARGAPGSRRDSGASFHSTATTSSLFSSTTSYSSSAFSPVVGTSGKPYGDRAGPMGSEPETTVSPDDESGSGSGGFGDAVPPPDPRTMDTPHSLEGRQLPPMRMSDGTLLITSASSLGAPRVLSPLPMDGQMEDAGFGSTAHGGKGKDRSGGNLPSASSVPHPSGSYSSSRNAPVRNSPGDWGHVRDPEWGPPGQLRGEPIPRSPSPSPSTFAFSTSDERSMDPRHGTSEPPTQSRSYASNERQNDRGGSQKYPLHVNTDASRHGRGPSHSHASPLSANANASDYPPFSSGPPSHDARSAREHQPYSPQHRSHPSHGGDEANGFSSDYARSGSDVVPSHVSRPRNPHQSSSGQSFRAQVQQRSASEAMSGLGPGGSGGVLVGGIPGPYSRTPELRVSHKIAERKRRKEMKELFDELRECLPADRAMKASKWEILTKAIDYVNQLKETDAEREREMNYLREENARLRGQPLPPSSGSQSHSGSFQSSHYPSASSSRHAPSSHSYAPDGTPSPGTGFSGGSGEDTYMRHAVEATYRASSNYAQQSRQNERYRDGPEDMSPDP